MEIAKQAVLLVGVFYAGWLLQNEPMIPVVWAALLALLFGVLLMVAALASPAISNRSLLQAHRVVSVADRARIDELSAEVVELDRLVESLRAEKRQLQALNDRLAFDLELASERLLELQREQDTDC